MTNILCDKGYDARLFGIADFESLKEREGIVARQKKCFWESLLKWSKRERDFR